MIQFNVMFRTGDERRKREKRVGIGKLSQRVVVKSKVAGDFDWVDRENSLHLLLAYNSLPVNCYYPC